jgi:hypothetical protein
MKYASEQTLKPFESILHEVHFQEYTSATTKIGKQTQTT